MTGQRKNYAGELEKSHVLFTVRRANRPAVIYPPAFCILFGAAASPLQDAAAPKEIQVVGLAAAPKGISMGAEAAILRWLQKPLLAPREPATEAAVRRREPAAGFRREKRLKALLEERARGARNGFCRSGY